MFIYYLFSKKLHCLTVNYKEAFTKKVRRLLLPFIRANVWGGGVAVFALQIDGDAARRENRLGFTIGDGEGIESEVVFIFIQEKFVVAGSVDAGFADIFQEIAELTGIVFDQTIHTHDAILELDIELGGIVSIKGIGEFDFIILRTEYDGVDKTRIEAVSAYRFTFGIITEEVVHAECRSIDAVTGNGAVGEIVVATIHEEDGSRAIVVNERVFGGDTTVETNDTAAGGVVNLHIAQG